MFFCIYNSFTVFWVEPKDPNVSTSKRLFLKLFLKVANATQIFKNFYLKDYNVHYISWREPKS